MLRFISILAAWIVPGPLAAAQPAHLEAGAAKVDVTNVKAGPVHDRLYVKALVLRSGSTTAAIITVDAVALDEIGSIGSDYLPKVRAQIQRELGIKPANVLINASHCHGTVVPDIAERTLRAAREAWRSLTPVHVGVGLGREDRIMENRRLKLRSGREADIRHAYAMPPDEEIDGVGPVDPEIGVLRLDRKDGRPLAVLYNFACHPIQGVPSGGNTADMTGFASSVIEDVLGQSAVALFLQGSGGDINPVFYKDVHHPRSAEPLGNMLGLSTLRTVRRIQTKEDGRLAVINETLALPRADLANRIASMEAEQIALLESLKGTSLNLKTFIPLFVKYGVSGAFPSYYAHHYLHEEATGRDDLKKLDDENRRNLRQYIENIRTMEQLTRIRTNLALLRKHHARNSAAAMRPLEVELLALRVGDFVLATFPGELTVQIGLDIKRMSPHPRTFVAAYTNGYIFYAPTAAQLRNPGSAQEDSDCLLAPAWQKLYEAKILEMLKKL
jgi:hypothetical protein